MTKLSIKLISFIYMMIFPMNIVTLWLYRYLHMNSDLSLSLISKPEARGARKTSLRQHFEKTLRRTRLKKGNPSSFR